ncbi:MAG: protein translocase subunit SecD [Verrucomicrobia bacterium]|nr:protein translocase subunit SecD [Verrucomicrobiota bacterium]
MENKLLGRSLLILAIVALSLSALWPPQDRDLVATFERTATQKDEAFTKLTDAIRKKQAAAPDRTYGNIRDAIEEQHLDLRKYFPKFAAKDSKNPNLDILARVQKLNAGKIRLGLDLKGGTSFLVELDVTKLDEFRRPEAVAQSIEVFRKRVDKFGVAEPVIQPVGDKRILIQLPGLTEADKQNARTIIQKTAYLEFKLVYQPEREGDPAMEDLIQRNEIPPGYEFKELSETREGQPYTEKLLVTQRPAGPPAQPRTGRYLPRASVVGDQMTGSPQIAYKFDSEGGKLFCEITKANIGRRLAIVLDGEVKSAPVIRSAIYGNGVIEGQFDIKEAYTLANTLENPLEAPAKILEERGVDPSLGRNNIESGVRASLIGAVAVLVFMIIYYWRAGIIANIALSMNILVLMGVMCTLGSTLTMPGIAGIVLTIGMAVDANVLIYERIREEMRQGKSMRAVIEAGFAKAFSTIIDSNLTTILAAIILILLGSGSVKGFGLTLTIGIAANIFTAVVVTRLMFDFKLQQGWLNKLGMMRLVPDTNFDFMGKAKWWFIASWLLIAAGTVNFVNRGGLHLNGEVYGVDFAGGDALTMTFAQRVNVDRLDSTISAAGVRESVIQYQKSVATGKELLEIKVGYEEGAKVEAALQKTFPEAQFTRVGIERVGPTVGLEILKSAGWAIFWGLIMILVYVMFRSEFSFGVGGVVATVHDVLMTIGWYCLSGREFSAPIVAAILTIIGYSINDTIVVFDRIREDLKLGMLGQSSYKAVMNRAINQTLSRTTLTSFTTFIATFALYWFGTGVVQDFAFCFLVGIITGTYSSIFIASPIVLFWHRREQAIAEQRGKDAKTAGVELPKA